MQAASEFALDPSGAAERHCRLFSERMGKKKKEKEKEKKRTHGKAESFTGQVRVRGKGRARHVTKTLSRYIYLRFFKIFVLAFWK